MLTESLNYCLPAELIAQKPPENRTGSKMLVLDRSNGQLTDLRFSDIGQFINAGDCLVLNDTKVVPARFFGHRATGGKIEGLWLGEPKAGVWEVMLKNARKVKIGEILSLSGRTGDDFCGATAVERIGDGRWLLEVDFDGDAEGLLGEIGFAPLPPYIKRGNDVEVGKEDIDRYQTVYAKESGAVAAPTAGLHFTQDMLGSLKAKGVEIAYVTLHVGAGTFKPVTADDLDDHEMHSERYAVSEEAAAKINNTKRAGGRVIAVGTTSVRTLESIGADGKITPCSGDTRLFIQPGYEFKIVDAMITNFHLPKSTLLALVGAFAGMETMMGAYRHAIEKRYRFFSYGDAMLII